MRWIFFLMLALAATASSTAVAIDGRAKLEPLTIEVAGNQYHFEVEVADDERERARGLMFREFLAENAGMLFLYPSARKVSFWMKNTLLPLDMIFIAEGGIVVALAENTEPLSEEPVTSEVPVMAVLEINGGLAKHLGVDVGARIRHAVYFP